MAAATLSASSAIASRLHATPAAAAHAGAANAPSDSPAAQKSAFFGNGAALRQAAPRSTAARSAAVQAEASCQPGWERARQRAAAQSAWWAARQARAGAGCGPATRRAAYANPWAAAIDPTAAMFMGPFWGGFGTMPRGGAWGGQMAGPQLLQDVFRSMRLAAGWDVEETDVAWILRINLPGFGPEDVKVQVVDSKVLQISAKAPGQEAAGGADQASRPAARRPAAGFEVRVPLPGNAVAADQVAAEVTRGVLRVTLPKVKSEAEKRRVVDVAVGGSATSAAQPAPEAPRESRSEAAAESAAGGSSAPQGQPEVGEDEGQIIA